MAYRYLDEAITYTAEDNLRPALAFSKPHQPIYWMTPLCVGGKESDIAIHNTVLSFHTEQGWFTVNRLEDFLKGWG